MDAEHCFVCFEFFDAILRPGALGVAPDRDAFTDMLVVADPVVPELAAWEVPALKGARDEGREVAGVLNASLLVGEDALKSEVASRARD